MGIADQIDALRRGFPECRIATFADLASGLVLFTSTPARIPQEKVDALCARARDLLRAPAMEAAEALLGYPVRHAVAPEADGLLVVIRSADDPDEALICQCAPAIDLTAFVATAARELAALGPVK
jgi:hypothetical protein